jgi:hypothetical protein
VSFSRISDIEQLEEIETTTSPRDEKKTVDWVEAKIREVREKVKKESLTVALLGAGGRGLDERRSLATELSTTGINVIVPEDRLPPELSPSIAERRLLSSRELDLAFVNIESWGSAAEFSEFHDDSKIAPKLRVIVDRRHHPIYGSASGYLTDVYLTHDTVFGHVYMHGDGAEGLPSSREIVMKISERFRQWKRVISK